MSDLRTTIIRFALGVWRYRWQAIGSAWLLCLVGWAAVTRLPDKYEANARLYVDADAVLTPLLKGLALDATVTSQIELLQRTLLSRPNLEKLISKTDLALSVQNPTDLERLVASLSNDIKLVPQTRNLFTISYRSTNPKLAYSVVQTTLDILIETKSGSTRTDMENAREFLEQQIKLYEDKLREAEGRRAEFKAKYVDLLPDANGASRMDAASDSLQQLQGQLVDATAKRDRLSKELAVTPATVVVETDPGTAANGGPGVGSLAAAQQTLQEMLLNSTDKHPDVIHQRRIVEMLKTSGGGAGGTAGRAARTRSDVNPVYNQLRLGMIDTAALVESLQRQVADASRDRQRLEQVARSVPGVQARYANLERDYDVIRKNYEELLARRESMRLAAAADADTEKVKLKVIDPAQVPGIPVGPKRLLLLSGVLIGGILAGIGGAALRVTLDRSFLTLADLRTLGLPIAGAISLLPRPGGTQPAITIGMAAVAVLMLCMVYGALMWQVTQTTGAA